jgi:hypothetical protein
MIVKTWSRLTYLEPNASGTGTLSPDGHFLGIASKSLDVFLNPMKRKTLISKPNVQCASLSELTGASKTPQAESIVDGNSYNGLPNCNRLVDNEGGVVALIWAASILEATAVNPEPDWEFCVLIACWAHNVEIKTVL